MEERQAPVPPEVEAAIKALLDDPSTAHAAYVLSSIANRATSALHKLARTAADAKRGTPEWGRWARLQNASRDAVLRTSTCREIAREISGKEA